MKKKKYWDSQHENAIEKYITSENKEEQNSIYVDIILPVFKELVYNIFYTYNFNKTFPDFHYMEHETLTHLYEKLNGVNVKKYLSFDKKNKGFSYFGTIAKRYLILSANKANKNVRLDELDHDLHIVGNSIEHFETKEKKENDIVLIGYLGQMLDGYIEEKINTSNTTQDDSGLTQEDIEVVYVVQHLLKNYQKFDIYNKKQLYIYIREATDMPTRKITDSLKKIKQIYLEAKMDLDH